jgi:hypothetical protein
MSRPIYRRASGLFLVVAGVLLACLAAVPPQAKCQEKAYRVDTTMRDALNQTLEKFEEINDPKTTLDEVLDRVAEKWKVTFRINERAFAAEGLDHPLKVAIAEKEPILKMRSTTPRAVLREILARVPARSAATFLIRRDAVEITTEAEVRRELGLPIPELAKDAKNALPVTPLVWEDFRDVPLADALDQIADVMEVTILIDTGVKDKAAAKIYATLRNVPTEAAVSALCDMAGLAVNRRHNVYFVTSPENAARLRSAERKK